MPRMPKLKKQLLDDPLVLEMPLPSGEWKEYSIPPCSAQTMVLLFILNKNTPLTREDIEMLATAAVKNSEAEVFRLSLGAAADEMTNDGVTGAWMKRATRTAKAWHLYGNEAAEEAWAGEEGKAQSLDSSNDTPTPKVVDGDVEPATESDQGTLWETTPDASGSTTSSPTK